MKRSAAILILLSISAVLPFIAPPTLAFEHDNRITASVIKDTSLTQGSRFNITVGVSDIGQLPEDLDGWEVSLQLNATLLMIRRVIDGPLLDDIAASYGQGGLLFTHSSITEAAMTGAVTVLESWLIGPPHPDDVGFIGSGDLVYVEVEVLELGYTWISFTNTKLRDVDGRMPAGFAPIVHRRVDGFFANVPYNIPPVASFTFYIKGATVGTPIFAGNPVTFNASSSADLDGSIAKYEWDFGDGTSPVQDPLPAINHTFTVTGSLTVTLTVTDNENSDAFISRSLIISGQDLPPVAIFSCVPENPKAGKTVTCDAGNSYDPEGRLAIPPDVPFLWDFGDGKTGGGKTIEHVYVRSDTYDVTLTVVDAAGQKSLTTRQIVVGPPEATNTQQSGLPFWLLPSGLAAGLVAAAAGYFIVRRRQRGQETPERDEFEG